MSLKTFAVAVSILLLGTVAFAGAGDMVSTGKIKTIDMAKNTMSLENGMEFKLAEKLQYTSFPQVGQEVLVTYEERDGNKVALKIHQDQKVK